MLHVIPIAHNAVLHGILDIQRMANSRSLITTHDVLQLDRLGDCLDHGSECSGLIREGREGRGRYLFRAQDRATYHTGKDRRWEVLTSIADLDRPQIPSITSGESTGGPYLDESRTIVTDNARLTGKS